jgi:hypothetical protein
MQVARGVRPGGEGEISQVALESHASGGAGPFPSRNNVPMRRFKSGARFVMCRSYPLLPLVNVGYLAARQPVPTARFELQPPHRPSNPQGNWGRKMEIKAELHLRS